MTQLNLLFLCFQNIKASYEREHKTAPCLIPTSITTSCQGQNGPDAWRKARNVNFVSYCKGVCFLEPMCILILSSQNWQEKLVQQISVKFRPNKVWWLHWRYCGLPWCHQVNVINTIFLLLIFSHTMLHSNNHKSKRIYVMDWNLCPLFSHYWQLALSQVQLLLWCLSNQCNGYNISPCLIPKVRYKLHLKVELSYF